MTAVANGRAVRTACAARQGADRSRRRLGLAAKLLSGVLVASLFPAMANAAGPIASSSFVGVEDPLSESGAWAALTSLSPNGGRFQKNNGAFPDQLGPNHAGARTTAAVPADQFSEIVVGHVGTTSNNVGPIVRVQASGPSIDSHYLWWASQPNGVNGLYRIDANGTGYGSTRIISSSSVADGDRLRLIARGPLIYGVKNGARDFIYNTGPDPVKYSSGTTGMLAWSGDGVLTDSRIASWSTDAAPVSSGTWASSTFTGVEDPLDEGDRWYPLPRYSGFRKAGVAIGKDADHTASGVWSIAPPANQYSEVTLGAVARGGGGPIVRIDRTNSGQTGWLLFLAPENLSLSGIYKMNPDGSFTGVRLFTPTIVSGDKWRLTANGNTLEAFRNGVSQFTYTTDGSYASGDVGIETYTPAFTFTAWEGGDTGGGDAIPPSQPTNLGATAMSASQINLGWTASTDNTAVTGYLVERCPGSPCGASFTEVGTAPGTTTTYSDAGLQASTTYSYQIRARDAAGNKSAYSNVASATTQASPTPTISDFTPTSGPTGTSVQINGTNFSGASSVTFNNVAATYAVSSPTVIQATVPSGAGTGPIGVTTPGGSANSASNFTVTVPPPTISGFAPPSGPVGTSVQINGTNFSGASAVKFNNVSATYTVSSPTTIQATVPSGATSGPIGVTTPGGTVNSAGVFRVVGAPTITSFTPTSGPVGTSVIIRGVDFTGATAVTFNTASAGFTVTSDSAIQATVPAGASTGPLSVTTAVGTGTSATSFTVMATLSANKAGNGGGTITSTSNPSNPTQINCGTSCSSSYPLGTVVTLTATPATGSNVTGWVGCDSVSGAVCTATVSAARSVTATFTLQRFLVTVTKSSPLGVGNGTVTSTSSPTSASQINCGSTCSVSFDYGTVVTLTAAPNLLAVFNGWDGCDSMSGATCTVNVTSAKSVHANFLP